MLKELMEVLICIGSFISGDYLDEQPVEDWYTKCNEVIVDNSVCHEEMTKEEYDKVWYAQYRKEAEEQERIEEQQYQQQLQELKEALNADDVNSIINYIEFDGKPNMESLARLLNGTYSYESTLYGGNGNRNRQYVEVNDLHISLTIYRSGDTSLSILKDMQVVYSKIWKYEK